MTLKLYGSPMSTCTRRVAVVLHEKKVPFELVPVDLGKGEHKAPEYLEKQPFGQVPYIDDDGFILYESRAIARYIEAKYPNQGTSLVPTDPKGRALFEQASSVEGSNFDPYASQAVFEVVFKPHMKLTPDRAVFDKLIAGLAAKLEAYDAILGKQKFLAGNEITLADLFHLPYGSMLAIAGSNVLETKPNVDRWFKEISSRPSWQAVEGGVKSTSSYA
ncbi:glutathione S-transferase [Collybia nuda]|uniref:glutathione transferase n=1 Tax=Collybia nuda TaxID=64659 RepID=A0A9P5Y0A5_9AGAR|nr:glutathione S-transferase [Collybia nuda]